MWMGRSKSNIAVGERTMPNLSYCRLASRTAALVTWHRLGTNLRRRLTISNFFDMISSKCRTKTRSTPLSWSGIIVQRATYATVSISAVVRDLSREPKHMYFHGPTTYGIGNAISSIRLISLRGQLYCAMRYAPKVQSQSSAPLSKPPANPIVCVERRPLPI